MAAQSTGIDRQDVQGPEPQPADAPGEAPLSTDERYHLLQTQRRRLVLRYLHGREGPVEMRDVAEQVAAWEHDTTVAELRSAQRQRVYISLYQNHLPALDEAGVIEYDQSRGRVEPTPRIHELYRLLELGEDAPGSELTGEEGGERAARDPIRYFRGASLASTGLVTAAWAGLIALPGVAVAAIVTTLFALLTLGVGVDVGVGR